MPVTGKKEKADLFMQISLFLDLEVMELIP
jgi:hypothetical protein